MAAAAPRHKHHPHPVTAAAAAAAALFYGLTSIALIFINKWAFMLFPLTNVVLLVQLAFTLCIFAAQRQLAPVAAFPAWDPAAARSAAPLSGIYLGNVVFSLLSLKGLNLPMYLVLRRNTPLVVILIKRVMRGSWPSAPVFFSVVTVCLGSIVAGFNDLEAQPIAYVFAGVSCLLQATYMMMIEVRSRGHAHPREGEPGHKPPMVLSEGEMLHYNALLSLPFVVAICAATGEFSRTAAAAATAVDKAGTVGLFGALAGCAGGGLVLNYAMMLCTSTNSALTTTVVGVLKGVVGTIAGFFVLGGAKMTSAGLAGVSLNTLGGCMYTYCKWQEKAAAKAPAAAALEEGGDGAKEALLGSPGGGAGGGGAGPAEEAAQKMELGAGGPRRR